MKKFIGVRTYILIAAMFSVASFTSQTQAQCVAPSLTFQNPVLVSGTSNQVGATYRFTKVTPTADAFVRIDSIVGGAHLTNIDNSSMGYSHAWQPVVSGPSTGVGTEYYIRWTVSFRATGTNTATSVACLNISAIDVDGDGNKIREFVEALNPVQHTVSNPTLLTVSMRNTSSGMAIRAMGSVANKPDIDTNALDTRVNFDFGTSVSFSIKTGARVDNNNSGGGAPERWFSLYFKNFVNTSTLPVRLLSFNGKSLGNNTIELKWVTEVEVNNKQFEIQRSFDGKEFRTVAIAFALEGSGVKAYSVKDALPADAPAKVYYRIKQVDIDGKFSITNIITVNSARDLNAGMKVTPNPIANDFAINLENDNQGVQAMRIVDLSGREVYRQSLNGQKIPAIRLSATQARMQAPGVYIAEVVFQDGTRLTQKMIRN
jgi:hypothetical protein